jgi:GDP-L-fucose synthase
MSFLAGKTIVITGGTGFVGHHLNLAMQNVPAKKIFSLGSSDYNLCSEVQVEKMFHELRPQVVFHLAGLNGGIGANKDRPADFLYQNLMMNTLMIHYGHINKCEKFIATGAGVGYPDSAPIPLAENDMWEGLPQSETIGYGLAKRMLCAEGEVYFQQYGFKVVTCIPGNVYGEFDNFSSAAAPVVPSLIRKFVDAKMKNSSTVEVWGTGQQTRDFVYGGDLAKGLIRAAEVYDKSEVVNISSGRETSIRQICDALKEITGFAGKVVFQSDKPDGQKRRWFNVEKAKKDLNFSADTALHDGLKKSVDWYIKENYK